MRSFRFSLLLCVATAAVSLVSAAANPTHATSLLGREIRLVVKHADLTHTIKAIEVYSRRHNRVLFASDSGLLLNPASNMKIVTTSFALSNLGTAFTFNTRLAIDGTRDHNSIPGNLVVLASGDPIISDADLDSAAHEIANLGITDIRGNIVIDISKFDSLEWGTGWMWDDEPQSYAMFICPASVDHDAIDVTIGIAPATRALNITPKPQTSFVNLISDAAPGSLDSLNITRILLNDTNTVVVSGTYTPSYTDTTYEFSVRHPALYFGSLLKEALEKFGVRLGGRVVSTRTPLTADSLMPLCKISHSIDTVVTYVNKVSDNLGAECLLRDVPYIMKGELGSADNGLEMEDAYLASCGVDSSDYVIVDGSGVSRYDVITPAALVKVLNHALDSPESRTFFKSLPIAGIDGSLHGRMKEHFVSGRVHAKTGSLSGVSTLSGYAITPGDTLVFSMMMQNYPAARDSLVTQLQNELCRILVLYSDNARVFRHNLRKHKVGTYSEGYRRRSSVHRKTGT